MKVTKKALLLSMQNSMVLRTLVDVKTKETLPELRKYIYEKFNMDGVAMTEDRTHIHFGNRLATKPVLVDNKCGTIRFASKRYVFTDMIGREGWGELKDLKVFTGIVNGEEVTGLRLQIGDGYMQYTPRTEELSKVFHTDKFSIEIPAQAVDEIAVSGSNDEAVSEWVLKVSMHHITDYALKEYVVECFADLEDKDFNDRMENEERMLWLACHDIKEEEVEEDTE